MYSCGLCVPLFLCVYNLHRLWERKRANALKTLRAPLTLSGKANVANFSGDVTYIAPLSAWWLRRVAPRDSSSGATTRSGQGHWLEKSRLWTRMNQFGCGIAVCVARSQLGSSPAIFAGIASSFWRCNLFAHWGRKSFARRGG